jgi:uncharacterized membrane protein
MNRIVVSCAALLALSACQPGDHGPTDVPGNAQDHQPFNGIGEGETVRFLGTEPFWNGQVKGTVLTYKDVEMPKEEVATVKRFAGRNGLSFTGTVNGEAFDMTVTPGECSDGMSDRGFPFTVTLSIGPKGGDRAIRNGCAWSDKQPFTGPEAP